MEKTIDNASAKSPENEGTDDKIQEQALAAPPQEQPKKSRREDRNKKEDKNVDQFMKSLNSVPTAEEKFSVVCKKYTQTAEENRKLQFYVKQSDKRYTLLLKEKDQLQHEFNKTVLVKSKLENLCRELQKQNKAIKEESLLKIREEEERRKETQGKFQNTLSEITALLQQNNEKNAKLRDDNISMTEKFKSVVQQYQLREQQVDKMAKQMALESQLADAKLQKASLEHQAEKERLMAEMEQMKVSIAQYHAKIVELQGTEAALKSQLLVYTDKYDEFQNALVKSNQVFGGFKDQMDTMSKKIKKLEKESLSWKKRWETSQTALLEMCGERQASEEKAAAAARQLHHMQSLCRTLQGERTVLLSTLKENNIERPPLPPPAPVTPLPPAPSSSSNAKVDAMAANCAQLRQSLAHLQSQLNVLTNKKEESPKPEKQKKSKSKKSKGDKTQKDEDKPEAKEPESDESNATKETTDNELNATESTANATSANEMIVNELMVNESNVDEPTVNELTANESTVNELTVNEATVNESTVNEATVNEVTVNEATVNESTVNETVSGNTHAQEELLDENTLQHLHEAINKVYLNAKDDDVDKVTETNDRTSKVSIVEIETLHDNADNKLKEIIASNSLQEIITNLETNLRN